VLTLQLRDATVFNTNFAFRKPDVLKCNNCQPPSI
jgi:hypothetical protein